MPRRHRKRNVPKTAPEMSAVGTALKVAIEYGPGLFRAAKECYAYWKPNNSDSNDIPEGEDSQGAHNNATEEGRQAGQPTTDETENGRRTCHEDVDEARREMQERAERVKEETEEKYRRETEKKTQACRPQENRNKEQACVQKEAPGRQPSESEAVDKRELPSGGGHHQQSELIPGHVSAAGADDRRVTGDRGPEPRSDQPPPRFCTRYWSRAGCATETCQQWHLCKSFLAGICKFGKKCRKCHDLDSAHNKLVCSKCNVPLNSVTIGQLQRRFTELRLAKDEFYHSQLELCHKQITADSCPGCNRIHLCRNYLEGTCTKGSNCKLSHSLRDRHNSGVLDRFRATNLDDNDILGRFFHKLRRK